MLRDSFARICLVSGELMDNMVGICSVAIWTPTHIALFSVQFALSCKHADEAMKLHFDGIANISYIAVIVAATF